MRKALLLGIMLLVAKPTFAQNPIVDEREAIWNTTTSAPVITSLVEGPGSGAVSTVGILGAFIGTAKCAVVWMTPSGTDVPTGQISFEAGYWRDNSSFVQITGTNGDYLWVQSPLFPHTTAFDGQEAGWRIPVSGMMRIRVRLTSALTGASTIRIGIRTTTTDCQSAVVVRQGDATRNQTMANLTVSNAVPAVVADGGAVTAKGDEYGAQFAVGRHPNQVTCFADNVAAVRVSLSNCSAQAGKAFYITDVIAISTTATAGAGTIQEGTGGTCGTGTIGVIPVLSSARTFTYPANTDARGPMVMSFNTPLKTLVNNEICVTGTAVNTLNIMLLGFYAK